ncbi:GNAT family N-acetyltransferase [Enterococcus sp. UD-01]|jgi:N-acetylglutamate synthase-like GNAT family acetyltransferase|uniref:GNAT family N-acetyltransferase n=1 Tax=Enterococcus sp. UD-01 TaxID=3373911 RepID=UPI0038356935
MEIRLADPSDFNEIDHLLEAAKKQMAQAHIYQWTTDYPNQKIIQEDLAGQQLYTLIDQGSIVAVATLTTEAPADYTLRRIATDPAYLANGYASILLNDIINRVKAKNGKHLYSSTNHSNLKMQNFFRKHGFEKVSEYKESEREHLGSFYKYLKRI